MDGQWGARKKNSFLSSATARFLVVCALHYPDDTFSLKAYGTKFHFSYDTNGGNNKSDLA